MPDIAVEAKPPEQPVTAPAQTPSGAPQASATAEASAATASSPAAQTPAAQTVEVHEPEIPAASDQAPKVVSGQIDILLDSSMSISVRVGTAEVKVRELLQMGAGSVLKLDRQVGQPVDLYLRGIHFATGHLVVVGDQFGVRIKEVLSGGKGEANAGL